jgi:uncharacterized Zn finger protein (UPF0148 family)
VTVDVTKELTCNRCGTPVESGDGHDGEVYCKHCGCGYSILSLLESMQATIYYLSQRIQELELDIEVRGEL